MSASKWDPSGSIVPTVNADSTLKFEKFTATAGQTLFTLTTFEYQPLSGSLLVEVQGVGQVLTQDYLETAIDKVTFIEPLQEGTQVVIRGFLGGENTQSAFQSQQLALASEIAAAASAAAALVSENNAAGHEAGAAAHETGAAVIEANCVVIENLITAIAGSLDYAITDNTGTNDALVAVTPIPPALRLDKYRVQIVLTGANTVINPTLDVDGFGASLITKFGGLPLDIGDLPGARAVSEFEWDGVNSRWELTNPAFVLTTPPPPQVSFPRLFFSMGA